LSAPWAPGQAHWALEESVPESAWPAPPQGTCALPASLEVEVAILGAGIHGAALARELTLRGVACALVDKGEVAAAPASGPANCCTEASATC
jgi:hypothetical protein